MLNRISKNKVYLEGSQDNQICVRPNKAFKHCMRKEKAMTWTRLEGIESCKRSDRRTDVRKERKMKAVYNVTRRHKSQ